jgi:hypothetical protein
MIEHNTDVNPNAIDSREFLTNEELRLSLTTDQLFAAIDLPRSIGVSDLEYEIKRAKKVIDPERERAHQARLQKHVAFIEAAQAVVDVYAEDALPHPQWSTRQLQRVLRNTQSELDYVTRQRDHYAQLGSDYIINWQTRSGEKPQRNDEYQREVAQKIVDLQAIIDQCTAILKARGI